MKEPLKILVQNVITKAGIHKTNNYGTSSSFDLLCFFMVGRSESADDTFSLSAYKNDVK